MLIDSSRSSKWKQDLVGCCKSTALNIIWFVTILVTKHNYTKNEDKIIYHYTFKNTLIACPNKLQSWVWGHSDINVSILNIHRIINSMAEQVLSAKNMANIYGLVNWWLTLNAITATKPPVWQTMTTNGNKPHGQWISIGNIGHTLLDSKAPGMVK